MSLLDTMPHRCTIRRRVRVKTGVLGGSKDPPTVEQTGVECWEQQLNAGEITEFMKRGINVSRKVYFPTNPGVTERHDILITSKRDAGGVYQEVTNPIAGDVVAVAEPDASAGLGVLFRVYINYHTGWSQ